MEIVIPILFAVVASTHLIDVVRKVWRIYTFPIATSALQPRISVIVCAHNEANNLWELMPRLLEQEYSSFEILCVLDRCTDTSAEVVRSFSSDKIRPIEIADSPPEIHPKKNALTHGIAAANGEWILLTDADCRPDAHWVTEMAKGMTYDKEVVLGISPYQNKEGLLNLLIQYETFTTALHFISSALAGTAYMGLGRNLAYRKSTFERKGGFGDLKSVLGGDDDLLVQRMANRANVGVVLTKVANVESVPKTDWKTYIHQKTRHFGVGKYYTASAKRNETMRWTIHSAMWLLFIWSIFHNWLLTLVIFIGAFLIKAISINIVADRLEKRFNLLWLPFVDVGYVVIFPLLSLRSYLVKRITWK